MVVLVVTDAHIYRLKDGTYWCQSIYGYSFWQRYLNTFDKVRIIARVKEVDSNNKMIRVDGKNVTVFEIPFFQGPKQLSRVLFQIIRKIKQISDFDAIIYRIPSPLGELVYKHISTPNTFGIEVVFNPMEFSENTIVMKCIKFYRIRQIKKMINKSDSVSYVTQSSIQNSLFRKKEIEKHFHDKNKYTTYYSSIDLHKEYFSVPKEYYSNNIFTISHINAAMNSNRKGEIVLLKAIKLLVDNGYYVKVKFIGDGNLRSEFENLTKQLDLKNQVYFCGRIADSDKLRQELLGSDLFVLPTVAEGLPRSILEAMALGLPIISTNVGGISEVIEENYLVPPNNPYELSRKIVELISNPHEMSRLSKRNIDIAHKYEYEILQEKRDKMYSYLREKVSIYDIKNRKT